MAGTLLSEIMPERVRERFGALMRSAAYFGVLAVSAVHLLAGPELGRRRMFLLGGIPALAVFLLRRTTPEPERRQDHADVRNRRAFWQPVTEVLTPPYRSRTIGNLLLLVVCVISLSAGSTDAPTATNNLSGDAGYGHTTTVRLAGVSSMTSAAFTVPGCLAVPRPAGRLGRRGALAVLFALMIVGTVGAYGVAHPLHSIPLTFAFLPVLSLGGASFAVFAIWLPEQNPARMRAIAFALPLTAVVFAARMGLVRLAPETRDLALPA